MNYKLKILPRAKQDLKEIAIWYEKAQKGLGKRFLAGAKAETPLFFRQNTITTKRF